MTIDGIQKYCCNQGLGYTSALPAFKFFIECQGHSWTRYVLFLWNREEDILCQDMAYPYNLHVYWQKKAGMMEISIDSGQWTTWKLFQISIT